MILDFIFDAIEAVCDFVIDVINGIFDFLKECVNWFKGLMLKRQRDIPFLADANKPEFKKMLQNAPKKNAGIFEGVFNQETDEITAARYVAADELDGQTRDVLGNDSLVILN